ncbi:peptidoglycan-binding protein [Faecalispora sporosphaeroides]|uniref:peptidoglycan-binding protein n=1 Tax=Faecalispora sporosphaeroides TaxID=1549 RepID=UPI00037FFB94|nr:peptidoglycan-binding protein [Faecalispora sporosphaeroides]
MGQLKRMIAGLLSAVLIVSAFTGCSSKGDISSGAAKQDFPVTIGTVTLKSEPAGVAVFSPNLADVILAMGYEISLKAKSNDCDQEDLSVLPNVDPSDPAAVKATGATLALFGANPGDGITAALQKEGILSLILPAAASRSDLERLYSEVGAAIKGGSTGYQKGIKTANNIYLTLDDITRVIPETDSPVTVCYLYDAKGKAATGDMLAGKLIESAGLVNAFAGSNGGQASTEALTISNPQYIFCAEGVKKQLQESDKYKKLEAVQKNRVYEMNPTYMERQGRGMIQAVSFMAGTVYPELLEGTLPSSKPSEPASSAPASSGGSSSSSSSSATSGKTPASSGQSAGAVPSGTYKRGDKSDAVKALQTRLDQLGYMFTAISGEYTAGTEQAVKDFQYLNGMEVTGIADPNTVAKLNSSEAKKRES